MHGNLLHDEIEKANNGNADAFPEGILKAIKCKNDDDRDFLLNIAMLVNDGENSLFYKSLGFGSLEKITTPSEFNDLSLVNIMLCIDYNRLCDFYEEAKLAGCIVNRAGCIVNSNSKNLTTPRVMHKDLQILDVSRLRTKSLKPEYAERLRKLHPVSKEGSSTMSPTCMNPFEDLSLKKKIALTIIALILLPITLILLATYGLYKAGTKMHGCCSKQADSNQPAFDITQP
ncbi:MAG: hypothetical protein OEY79_04225 [Anaplasmataceae bacterium]|nr:hypothetical protein [Anaplasmataceae bacterium]